MAERRMFHRLVVESDKFLDLPIGAQALYFHLGMQADDDGFVNGPRVITRQLKRPAKDLQALIDSEFLLDFDGIVVLRHWRVANWLKTDRLQLPKYPELARKLYISDTNAYTKVRPRKGHNLLAYKKKLIADHGSRMEAQKKEAEKKKEKNNLYENSNKEMRDENDDPCFSYLPGPFGKGIVLLTQEQEADLRLRLGEDAFDFYVQRLTDYIMRNKRTVRNHYETILKWWGEDSVVQL